VYDLWRTIKLHNPAEMGRWIIKVNENGLYINGLYITLGVTNHLLSVALYTHFLAYMENANFLVTEASYSKQDKFSGLWVTGFRGCCSNNK